MRLLAVGCRRWLLLLSSLSSLPLSPSLPVAAVAAGRAAVLCCCWPRPGFPLCPAAPPWLPRSPARSSVALVFLVWSPVPGPVGFAVPAVLWGFSGFWVGSGLWSVLCCSGSGGGGGFFRFWLFLLFLLLGLWALLSSGLSHAVSGFPDSCPFACPSQLASHAPFPDFRISVLFRFHVAIGVPRCSRCSALRARWPSRFRR